MKKVFSIIFLLLNFSIFNAFPQGYSPKEALTYKVKSWVNPCPSVRYSSRDCVVWIYYSPVYNQARIYYVCNRYKYEESDARNTWREIVDDIMRCKYPDLSTKRYYKYRIIPSPSFSLKFVYKLIDDKNIGAPDSIINFGDERNIVAFWEAEVQFSD